MVVRVYLNLTVMERAEATQSRNVGVLDKLFKADHAWKSLSGKVFEASACHADLHSTPIKALSAGNL